jgi:hypothetical protein
VAPKRHLDEKASDWQLQLSGFPINLIEPVSGIICNVEQKFIHHRIAGIYCLNIALQDLYSSACIMAGIGVLCQTQQGKKRVEAYDQVAPNWEEKGLTPKQQLRIRELLQQQDVH